MHSPRRPRYDTLDAWRGLACLLVVMVFYIKQLFKIGDAE